MSATTNAFWREVMDFLPGLTLLFRIDDQELAHLMFVTESVRSELGFSPEEYVLASEEEQTVVSQELDILIDTIAERSHNNDISSDPVCRLTDRTGTTLEYTFDFRLFRTKSARHNLISVTLFPKGSVPAATTAERNSDSSSAFVAQSQLMQDVLERVDTLSQQSMHVLIRGEQSVGKKTLAEMLARKAAILSGNQQVWVLNLPEIKKEGMNGQRLFAGLDVGNTDESLLDEIEKDLQLVIVELGQMKLADQSDLLKLMAKRAAAGRKTRIIATSSESVEELMQAGKIDPALVYKMSFMSVFVPPLRERMEDVAEIARIYTNQVAEVLNLPKPEMTNKVIRKLMDGGLKGNVDELHMLLRDRVMERATPKSATSTGVGTGDTMFFSIDGPAPYDHVSAAYLKRVLEHTSGKIYGNDGAASLLEMKPTTLQSRLKKLNVR